MSNTSEKDAPRAVQVPTVVWGFILIAIAVWCFAFSQVDLGDVSPGVVITWIVLGIGSLAIVGGLVGVLFRRR